MSDADIANTVEAFKVPVLPSLISHYDAIERRLGKKPKLPVKPIKITIDCHDEIKTVRVIHKKTPHLSPLPKIIRFVASREGVTVEQIVGSSRRHCFVRPRQIAMYLMREVAKKSYPEIGRKFGGKDHTTVMHAHRALPKRASLDPILSARLQWYVEQVQGMVA